MGYVCVDCGHFSEYAARKCSDAADVKRCVICDKILKETTLKGDSMVSTPNTIIHNGKTKTNVGDMSLYTVPLNEPIVYYLIQIIQKLDMILEEIKDIAKYMGEE